jgi:TetR/AcrR family transcriptional repressor of nem operon
MSAPFQNKPVDLFYIKQTGCPVLSIWYFPEIAFVEMKMTKQPVERTRTNDPDGTRRKVLDVAEKAFQERGYNATSLGDLMKAAGVSGGALHYHFRNKKAIGLAVINERVAAAVDETWIAPVAEASSARDGVRSVFEAVAAELDAQGFVRGCPLNNLSHELSLADPDFRAALADIFAKWREAIAEKLKFDQKNGLENATIDAERFAIRTIAAYSGAMSLAKVEQNSDALRQCVEGADRVSAARIRQL